MAADLVRVLDGARLGALARRTAGTQTAVLEATHRVEATREVVLVERQAVGGAETITIAQFGVQAQGVVVGDWLEQLAAVVDLEERQVAAWSGYLGAQALGVTTGRQHALVEGRFRPARRSLEVQEAVIAFLIRKSKISSTVYLPVLILSCCTFRPKVRREVSLIG